MPAAHAAGSADSPTFVSSDALDSRVIFQDFSFYQPYESNTYRTLTEKAPALAELGITDVWTAPASRALNAYNEEGYAVTDRYDLGEFPAGHNGETATKYGTSDELKTAIAAMHDAGMNVQADIVPNQVYNYQDREIVRVTAVDQWGTPNRADVENKLYEVYTKSSPAGQQKYGTFSQWNSSLLNGISVQELGTDRVMLDPDGTAYQYFGPDDERNYLPDWLAESRAQQTGEINAIDTYLTVAGYYAVEHTDNGPIWRSFLLHYEENQPGAITIGYLDYMRDHGYGGSADATDDEVRADIISRSDSEAQNSTNDYIGSQPGYSSASEAGITALRFDDDFSGVNENNLQYEFLIGQDVDNSSDVMQAEQRNWEEFLLDEYGFDGFRFDAAGHYNKEILEQSADLFAERYGDDQLDHLNFIESYVDEQVPFLNSTGNGQLAYDDEMHYAYLNALGEGDPTQPLSTTTTNSFANRSGDGPDSSDVIPNWSFVTNHDTEHNEMAQIPLTAEQAGGFPYGTKEYQLAQYAIYTADRQEVDKDWAPYNVPAAYALALTNKNTVPTVFYGDMWEAAESYMTVESPYYDAITTLLEARKTNVSGEQTVTNYVSNLSSTPGQDLISSVRAGTDRASGIGVVVGNQPELDTTIEVEMGADHADQVYVDALGYQSERLTTDADGVLTVNVMGSKSVEVNGYLAAWVPAAPVETATTLETAKPATNEGISTTVDVTVASANDDATGTVELLDGTTVLGSVELKNGSAAFTTPSDLAVGVHSLTARYSGDERNAASVSAAVTLVVVSTSSATNPTVPSDGNTGGGTGDGGNTDEGDTDGGNTDGGSTDGGSIGGGNADDGTDGGSTDGDTDGGSTDGNTGVGSGTGSDDAGDDASRDADGLAVTGGVSGSGSATAGDDTSRVGGLAVTGGEIAPIAGAAVVLLAAGAGVLLWVRRRRTTQL
jgi:dextransucrase